MSFTVSDRDFFAACPSMFKLGVADSCLIKIFVKYTEGRPTALEVQPTGKVKFITKELKDAAI